MSERPDIYDAIFAINPDAIFRCDGDEAYENFTWQDGTTPIPSEDIQTKLNELQAAYDAQDYARKRKSEYPIIADQLDDIYHNGIDGWKATIKITKDKYPKG